MKIYTLSDYILTYLTRLHISRKKSNNAIILRDNTNREANLIILHLTNIVFETKKAPPEPQMLRVRLMLRILLLLGMLHFRKYYVYILCHVFLNALGHVRLVPVNADMEADFMFHGRFSCVKIPPVFQYRRQGYMKGCQYICVRHRSPGRGSRKQSLSANQYFHRIFGNICESYFVLEIIDPFIGIVNKNHGTLAFIRHPVGRFHHRLSLPGPLGAVNNLYQSNQPFLTCLLFKLS